MVLVEIERILLEFAGANQITPMLIVILLDVLVLDLLQKFLVESKHTLIQINRPYHMYMPSSILQPDKPFYSFENRSLLHLFHRFDQPAYASPPVLQQLLLDSALHTLILLDVQAV
jgi:hypothetical protein